MVKKLRNFLFYLLKIDVAYHAAAITFYSFISFFPLIVVLFSLFVFLGKFLVSSLSISDLNGLGQLTLIIFKNTLPPQIYDFFAESWNRFLAQDHSNFLTISFVVVLLSSLKAGEKLVATTRKILLMDFNYQKSHYLKDNLLSAQLIIFMALPIFLSTVITLIPPIVQSVSSFASAQTEYLPQKIITGLLTQVKQILSYNPIFQMIGKIYQFLEGHFYLIKKILFLGQVVFISSISTLICRYSIPQNFRVHFNFKFFFVFMAILSLFLSQIAEMILSFKLKNSLSIYGPALQILAFYLFIHFSLVCYFFGVTLIAYNRVDKK